MTGKWTANGAELATKDGAFKARIAGRVQAYSAFIQSPARRGSAAGPRCCTLRPLHFVVLPLQIGCRSLRVVEVAIRASGKLLECRHGDVGAERTNGSVAHDDDATRGVKSVQLALVPSVYGHGTLQLGRGRDFAGRGSARCDWAARARADNVIALRCPGAAHSPSSGPRIGVSFVRRPTFVARARLADQQRVAKSVCDLGHARLSIRSEATIHEFCTGVAKPKAHPDVSVVIRPTHRPIVGDGRQEIGLNRVGADDVLAGYGGAFVNRDADRSGDLVGALIPVQSEVISTARRNQTVSLFEVRQTHRPNAWLGVVRRRRAASSDTQIVV